jgi:hypothetical protein
MRHINLTIPKKNIYENRIRKLSNILVVLLLVKAKVIIKIKKYHKCFKIF